MCSAECTLKETGGVKTGSEVSSLRVLPGATDGHPGRSGAAASHMRPHLSSGHTFGRAPLGQRGSQGGMKPVPTAAETERQHQVRKNSFFLRGLLPGMSSDHTNCRKPTQVLMPVLRAQAERGFIKLMPEQWETCRARTRLGRQERLDKRNANDLKISVINRSCTFILGMLDKHTNHRTNVLHCRREPFLQTQLP